VGFEWDEAGKAGINFRKHGVRMPEAIPVFDDPYAITITDDEADPDEQRFVTIGMGAMGRLLVVVYAWRGDNIRIIWRAPPRPMNVSNTRQNDERPIRFQQREEGQGSSARA